MEREKHDAEGHVVLYKDYSSQDAAKASSNVSPSSTSTGNSVESKSFDAPSSFDTSTSAALGESRVTVQRNFRLLQWLRSLPTGAPPVIFSELGLDAKNLLTKGFQAGQNASVTTITPVGVMLTSAVTKMDELVMGLVTATLCPAPGLTAELSGGTTGMIQGRMTWQDAASGFCFSASNSFPASKAGFATLQYKTPHFTLYGESGLHSKPPLLFSATLGGLKGDVTMGMQAGFDSATNQMTTAVAGVGITQGPVMASAMFNLRATQNIEVALSQAIDSNLSLALHFSAAPDGRAPGTLTCGGCVKLDEGTSITAKVDTNGKVAGLLQHEFKPNSTVSVLAEYDSRGKGSLAENPKIGVSINYFQ